MKLVSVKMDETLYLRLTKYAVEHNKSRSQVIRDALELLFSVNSEEDIKIRVEKIKLK